MSGEAEKYDTVSVGSRAGADLDTVDLPDQSEGDHFTDAGGQALQKLRDAATSVATDQRKPGRLPRASRLTPVYDISADIQRYSTPMRRVSGKARPLGVDEPELDLPDLWPLLQDTDVMVSQDSWMDHADPLRSRHRPGSATATSLKKDIQHATAGTFASPERRNHVSRTRLVLTWLSVCAVLLILADGLLLSSRLLHPQTTLPSLLPVKAAVGTPSLTLSADTAYYGQSITLYIRHFSGSNLVSLTHDVGVVLQIDGGKSPVRVGADGSLNVVLHIDTNWSAGAHTLSAEDVKTHYVAHASLQIIGKARPSQLVLSTAQLDLGADIQGASTTQALKLSNSGSANISWSASSDQSWLLLTPVQGTFSDTQIIAIAGQRANLSPGDYTGRITFVSSTGSSQVLQVKMKVNALPFNADPILSVTPAIVSFQALDGGSDPDTQVLSVSNPGSQPLYWSLQEIAPTFPAAQDPFVSSGDTPNIWLNTDLTSGIVMPSASGDIHLSAHSHNLLPGTYLSTLVFTTSAGYTALDETQNVVVSMTVQPHCGLTLSAGSMAFTAVAGQNNPGNQSLSFTSTGVCPGAANWHASASAVWLVVTPGSGQLVDDANGVLTVGVNATSLRPGTYQATIALTTIQTTQSVPVQLTVQQAPSLVAPIMGASPLALTFSTTQGQSDPPGQSVTITNTGGSQVTWHAAVNNQISWLNVSAGTGSIPAGQSTQLTVTVSGSQMTAGSYVGQVTIFGADAHNVVAAGSPQTITVNLVVLAPCTFSPPPSSAVSFSAANSDQQSLAVSAVGNCSWPVSWKAKVVGSAPWLQLSPSSGTQTDSGQTNKIAASLKSTNLAPGTYQAQVSVTGTDASNTAIQGSPQTYSISLIVQPSCALQTSSSSLSFSLMQGQGSSTASSSGQSSFTQAQSNPTTQKVAFNESGNCALPLSWNATTDAASVSWLSVTPGSGSDNGSNAIHVSVDASKLAPGNYQGSVTLAVSGSNNSAVLNSPLTIPVTVTVTGLTISGTVDACMDSGCSTPKVLAGAGLSLMKGNTTVASTTADSGGNFKFKNVPAGSYTLSAGGTDSSGTAYTGNASITVTGNQQNIAVNTFSNP